LEVVGTSEEDMLKQGLVLYDTFSEFHPHGTFIKIPVNPSMDEKDPVSFAGLEVIKKLSEQGIPVNCTLINRPEQGVAAALAGAKLLSPFAGRIDDMLRKKIGMKFDKSDYFPADGIVDSSRERLRDDNGIVSGVDLVRILSLAKKEKNLKSDILAASVRNVMQTLECAYICDADIATVPFYIIEEMKKKGIKIEKEIPHEFHMKKEALIDNSIFDTSIIDDIVEEGIKKYPKALYHPKTMEGMMLFTKDAEALKELYQELFASVR
jgi:transaldolase